MERRKRILEFFVVVVGLISLYGTQQGISSQNPNQIISWGAAIGLNGALTASWIYLMEMFPKVNREERRQFSIVMAAMCVITFFASTQFTVIAFGGSEAVRTHHEQTLQAADSQALKLYRRQAAIANSATQFEGLSKQYDRLAAEEDKKGVMSGITGVGSVVNTLRNVGGLLSEMARTSDRTDKSYEKLYGQFKEESSKARKVVADIERIQLDDLDKLRELNLQFGGELAQINENTARMAETSSSGYLKATIDSITELTRISHSSDRPEQKKALEAIEPVIDATQKVLLRITPSGNTQEEVEVQTFTMISPIRAVYRYWKNTLWAWAFGLGLDFFPVYFLFLVTIGRRAELEANEQEVESSRPRRVG